MQYVIKIYSPMWRISLSESRQVYKPGSQSNNGMANIGTNDYHLATKNTNDTLTRLPKQFIWESNSPQKFRAALQSRGIQRMIHDFLVDSGPDRNINTSLDAVENIFLTTAKRCLKIKVIKKRHVRSPADNKWFDKDCRLKRHELRKLCEPRSTHVMRY